MAFFDDSLMCYDRYRAQGANNADNNQKLDKRECLFVSLGAPDVVEQSQHCLRRFDRLVVGSG